MHRSKWGDENLYIRHQRMDEDLKFHPEWDAHLERFEGMKKKDALSALFNGVGGGCPFGY